MDGMNERSESLRRAAAHARNLANEGDTSPRMPDVHRAVADWLDIMVPYADSSEEDDDERDAALAVARAYLGDARD